MLDAKTIKEFEDRGFSRWQKHGIDRLYARAFDLGLRTQKNNRGTLGSATMQGEYCSNASAQRMMRAKTYIDVRTGELVCDTPDLQEYAEKVYREVIK